MPNFILFPDIIVLKYLGILNIHISTKNTLSASPWGKYRKLNMIISYNLHILILGINLRLGIQKCMCYRFNLEINKMGWNNVR